MTHKFIGDWFADYAAHYDELMERRDTITITTSTSQPINQSIDTFFILNDCLMEGNATVTAP